VIVAGALWMFLCSQHRGVRRHHAAGHVRRQPLGHLRATRGLGVHQRRASRARCEAALVASVLAIALGIVLSLCAARRIAWIRIPTASCIEFFRGMPVLLMMLFILLVARPATSGPSCRADLYNGALIGEALRAGLAALPRGQREAALSVGMRQLQSKMLVEFPQAFRQMLPIIVAQLVVLLKDTSLGYIVGYTELLRTT
jgi:glutamate transport system permease protein